MRRTFGGVTLRDLLFSLIRIEVVVFDSLTEPILRLMNGSSDESDAEFPSKVRSE